jgi:SAM-dependent methyltransferase
MPFPDNSFDIVFSHGVLHHIPDILAAQKEIARVLKPGGQLIAMLYARRSLNYLVAISVVRRLGIAVLCLGQFKTERNYRRPHCQCEKAGAVEIPENVELHSLQHRRAAKPLQQSV